MQSWFIRTHKLPLALGASAWFPASHGGSALRATRFTTHWTQCLGVKGQEPRARPQPQQLTVMLKDHTQHADLWGLHRAWAGLSNKALYGLSVYLCPASGTQFTAYYSKTMTHWIFNSNDRKLRVTKSQQSAKVFRIAQQKQLLKFIAPFIVSPEKVHVQYSKAFKLLNFQTSCSGELIVLEGQQQQSGPLQILSRLFWRALS